LKEEGDFGSCGLAKLANSQLVGPQKQQRVDLSPWGSKNYYIKDFRKRRKRIPSITY
jgi:hypothetical protein